MRLREAVASALHLLIVLTLFLLSIATLILARREDRMEAMLRFLDQTPHIFYWMALGFGASALFFLWGFHGIGRGRYLSLEMGENRAIIDAKLVRLAIEECFKKHYPEQIHGANVVASKDKRLEVALDLAPLSEEAQLELLSEMEPKLQELLQRQFGYRNSLSLYVRSR